MNKLLVLLLLSAMAFAQQPASLNGVPNQTSTGIQYDNAAAYAWFGDSLLMVTTTDNASTLKLSSTVSAASCNGSTCSITDATGVGASFYRVGMWLMPGADSLLGFSPGCLAVSRVQVTGIVGNVVSFSEAQTIIPAGSGGTHSTGCTGTVSGTGGTVQDVSNLTPFQASTMPYFSRGGLGSVFYNWSWPGQTISDLASHLTATGYMTGIPSGSYVFVQSNDYCGTNNPTTFIGFLKTIATNIHAAGHKAFLSSSPIGPTYNCGLSVTGDATYALVTEWIQQSAQCPAANAPTNCFDGVIDQTSFSVTSRLDSTLVNQTGSLAGHLTDLGNAKSAGVYNQAMVNKFSTNTGGLITTGGGTLRGMVNAGAYGITQPAGFSVDAWSVYDVSGFAILSNLATMYAGNRLIYQPLASVCWNYDSTAPLNNQCDESGFSRSQYGNGVAISGFSDASHGNGSLDFSTWRPTGFTSTPTFVVDGQEYYRSDLHQWCYNNNGTAQCGWGAGTIPLSSVTAGSTGSGTFDFSAATQLKLPVAASYTAVANGEQGYDLSAKNWHIFSNAVDNLLGVFPASSLPTNGHCTQWLVVSGVVTLGDAGASCGGAGGPPTGAAGGSLAGTYPNPSLKSQYQSFSCEPGYGDGLNAITAGTYLQTTCYNASGVTWTISNIRCFTDNNGTSTMSVTNGAGTALLTGAVTCSNSFAAGTQSGTTTIAAGDFLKFTFVSDGSSKQATFVVNGAY